ncbi:putative maltose O-acetyltransferase, partial [Dissostichus eleginoides]
TRPTCAFAVFSSATGAVEGLPGAACQHSHKGHRNKRRQKIVQKIAQEKKRLLEDIHKYNQQPDGDPIDTNKVVEKLSTKSAESMIWPWQEPNRGYPNGITEEGYKGLMCLLRRNLDDLRLKQQTVAGAYRGILEPSSRLVEEDDEDMEEEKDWQSDNSSDDEDDAEEGT